MFDIFSGEKNELDSLISFTNQLYKLLPTAILFNETRDENIFCMSIVDETEDVHFRWGSSVRDSTSRVDKFAIEIHVEVLNSVRF